MHSVSFYMIRKVVEQNKVSEVGDLKALHEATVRLVDWLPSLDGVSTEEIEWAGRPALRIHPPSYDEARQLLYLHGGAYCFGDGRTHGDLAARLGHAARAQVLLPEYRLAPEHPFPAALDDAFAAYRALLDEGIEARNLTVAGDSAGGGLTLALLLRLRDEGLPLPAAAACMSPWADLSCSGESMATRAEADPMLAVPVVHAFAEAYLAGADPRNPGASPLWGELHGLPPVMIQVGTAEVLHDDARRWAEKARAAGVEVVFEAWDDMFHVWQICAGLMSEGHEALEKLGRFLREAGA